MMSCNEFTELDRLSCEDKSISLPSPLVVNVSNTLGPPHVEA